MISKSQLWLSLGRPWLNPSLKLSIDTLCPQTFGAFREHSGNIQGTFREHSGRVEADARGPPSQLQEALTESTKVDAEYSLPTRIPNIKGTFREHSENIQGTLKEHSWSRFSNLGG
jgi:hypothetical protein